jgi:hypothetical protein
MGAVAALLDASCNDPLLACVIADSPFASLTELCGDFVRRATGGLQAGLFYDQASATDRG